MADQDLPEPSSAGSGRGKQLVFLFMSAVVVSVVIFLLGVSVGRGVRKGADTTSATDVATTDPTAAATAPPQASSSALNYHDSVRSGAPAGPSRASKPADPPPATAPDSGPPPAVNEAPATKDKPKERTPSVPPASSTSHRGPQYFLQVGAYGTQSAAQKVMSKVKAADSSYSVTTVTLPGSAPPPRFKVMVGPYSSVDEAKGVMARLKKQGFATILRR